jgi:AraC family transcriptional regulator of adaptative response/methylated-DNA-[protein]-cysteine methyltransferase
METGIIPEGFPDAQRYLRAVMERDRSFDGVFVFGASSTGIYCRPSCPARRPRAGRIILFPGPEAAEDAGLRECLRCGPKLTSRRAELVAGVCAYVQDNLAGDLRLEALGERFSVSPYHLQRVFKEVVGMSPRRYTEECRISRLKTHLAGGDSVAKSLRKVGYGSQSWLYADSTAKLGMTPGTYRRGGLGMRIVYQTGGSPLGRMLVAATAHGICMVTLGESDEQLANALRKEYPKAILSRSPDAQTHFKAVLDWFNGRQTKIPLDLRGTEFQRKVWAALQRIPDGRVCTYSDIAVLIGRPSAVRAVANACGKNPVPLIVPCHRVVRKDGSLGGYGLGVWRKRALLAEEEKRAGAAQSREAAKRSR